MIVTLLFFGVFWFITLPFGWLLLRPLTGQKEELPSLPWLSLTGLVLLISVAALLSLVWPLDFRPWLLIVPLALGLWAFLPALRAQLRGRLAWGWPLVALALLSVLQNALYPASNSDTGLYHAQAIHWIETQPVVPGLGNLHARLAFNSHWYVGNALFSFSFLGLRSLHLLPAVLFALFVLDVGQGLRPTSLANALRILLLPAAFYTLGAEISSPGSDLPVALLTWLLAVLWLDCNAPAGRFPRSAGRALLFLLPFFALTLKLSALPLLLFSLNELVQLLRQRAWRRSAALLGLAGLIVLPWLARSFFLSGYLFFPQTAFNWFNPDWKVPLEEALFRQGEIIGWARLPGEPTDWAAGLPLLDWAPRWFADLTANQRLLVIAAALAPLPVVLLRSLRFLRLPMAIAWLGLAFWFFTAPALRFGYGWLILLLLLPLAGLLWMVQAQLDLLRDLRPRRVSWLLRGLRRLPVLLLVGLFAYQALFLAHSLDAKQLQSAWLFPADYPGLPSKLCTLEDGTPLWQAEQYLQCWYEPFPCVPVCPTDVISRQNGRGFRPSSP
jgi:hypothetical protein